MPADPDSLQSLPRHPKLELEGAIRPLKLFTVNGGRYEQPAIALWVEAGTGRICSLDIVTGKNGRVGDIAEAIDGLVFGLSDPRDAVIHGKTVEVEPGLPQRVVVDDASLAEATRAVLDRFNIPVHVSKDLPALDSTYSIVNAIMGGDHEVELPPPFSWDIDPALPLPLFQTIARYAELAPWKYLHDQPPMAISLGENGPRDDIETLYGCVVGSLGDSHAITFFYTLADTHRAVDEDEELGTSDEDLEAIIAEMGAIGIGNLDVERDDALEAARAVAVDRGLRPEPSWEWESLTCFLSNLENSHPSYLTWMQERALPVASDRDIPRLVRTGEPGGPREVDDREARAFLAALQAVNGLLEGFRWRIVPYVVPSEPLVARVPTPSLGTDRLVEVRWPFI